MKKGIDTSKWQGSKVDYAAARKAGYSFVILRIGYSKTKDKCFEKDYAAAIAAGLKVGVYFYTRSTTEAGAIQDATRVLGWLNKRHLDLGVTFDLEDKSQKGTNRRKINSAMYNAFAAKIRTAGYEAMLYTGEYFYNNYFDKSAVKDKLWIAKYSSKQPNVGRSITLWQYTSDAYATDFYKAKLDRNMMLIEFTENPIPSNPYPVPTRLLKRKYPMMQGTDVKWVQTELNAKGYNLIVDGKFGNDTKNAVIDYQKKHGLLADGIVGSATRYSLLND